MLVRSLGLERSIWSKRPGGDRVENAALTAAAATRTTTL